ncbi:MAG: C69 family dipeptidase [Trueperaceae bacterium]|nr:C69 family dipeptidase [Trueperaceae bacterium]
MCDTLVVLGGRSREGVTLFAKNSDREPNEAQVLFSAPRADHAAGESVECTYLSIPQAAVTHAVLLSKPFWMWGAEMGVNEHGVAIGNEALFTKGPPNPSPALLGMDLVRLALERAASAGEALAVITTLLERHGQGGNAALSRQFEYDNSYLLADAREAYVLETVGREWVAKRVHDHYAISNGATLTNDWDTASLGVTTRAVKAGWAPEGLPFDFAEAYCDPERTAATACGSRRQRLQAHVTGPGPDHKLGVLGAMRALRDHGGQADWWGEASIPTQKTVCMHAAGAHQISQTTGSLVAALYPEGPVCFATGTAAPCLSVFKPVWPGVPLVPEAAPARADFGPGTLFWQHELLHRLILLTGTSLTVAQLAARDEFEQTTVAEALAARWESRESRQRLSARSFAAARELGAEWLADARRRTAGNGPADAASVPEERRANVETWHRINREAELTYELLRSAP